MGVPALVDAAILAPASLLGLLGVGLGFGRLLAAWPMRWLIPLIGGSIVALPAMLHLATQARVADLLGNPASAAMAIAGIISAAATVVLLVLFMRNLRARMAIWTAGRRIPLAERLLGALCGIACGMLLVAIPYGLYEALRPGRGDDPAWARESLVLPYLRGASEVVRNTLSTYTSSASRMLRR